MSFLLSRSFKRKTYTLRIYFHCHMEDDSDEVQPPATCSPSRPPDEACNELTRNATRQRRQSPRLSLTRQAIASKVRQQKETLLSSKTQSKPKQTFKSSSLSPCPPTNSSSNTAKKASKHQAKARKSKEKQEIGPAGSLAIEEEQDIIHRQVENDLSEKGGTQSVDSSAEPLQKDDAIERRLAERNQTQSKRKRRSQSQAVGEMSSRIPKCEGLEQQSHAQDEHADDSYDSDDEDSGNEDEARRRKTGTRKRKPSKSSNKRREFQKVKAKPRGGVQQQLEEQQLEQQQQQEESDSESDEENNNDDPAKVRRRKKLKVSEALNKNRRGKQSERTCPHCSKVISTKVGLKYHVGRMR